MRNRHIASTLVLGLLITLAAALPGQIDKQNAKMGLEASPVEVTPLDTL